MSCGHKRSAESEIHGEDKSCKQNNCTELSSTSTPMPQDCDLSTLEGLLALLSFRYEDIIGKGIMKHFIILRLLYAARVNGADLFHLGEVCKQYLNHLLKIEHQYPSTVCKYKIRLRRSVTPLFRSMLQLLLVSISRKYVFGETSTPIFLGNSSGMNVFTSFKKSASPRATKVRLQ